MAIIRTLYVALYHSLVNVLIPVCESGRRTVDSQRHSMKLHVSFTFFPFQISAKTDVAKQKVAAHISHGFLSIKFFAASIFDGQINRNYDATVLLLKPR